MKNKIVRATGFLIFLAFVNPFRCTASVNPKDPVLNFEHVWKTLDRNYAQFGVKHVDWAALYNVYRPQVKAGTTDEELWNILLAMVGNLNDEHVCLADSTRRICAGWSEGFKANDFSLELVKSKYLQKNFSEALGGSFISGWLTEGIGYLRIGDFKDNLDSVTKTIDQIMSEFAQARAMVIDVRDNPGGTGRAAEIVASRFADQRRHYLNTQTRYGPKHDDLGPTEYRNVAPDGPLQFTRPTVLLAHRFSTSAADIFVLAMRVLPQVTVIGDLTAGALSAQFPEKLPNGWTLWVAFKVVRDHNGSCWDGAGIPPDLRVCNSAADIATGKDRVLEFAIQFLQKGNPVLQDESASLVDLKTSLVDEYMRWVSQEGVEAASARLKQTDATAGGSLFFSFDEAVQQAGQYIGQKRYSEAIGLLLTCRENFPQLASTYSLLAQAYIGRGDVATAEATLEEGKSVEAMFPWEPAQMERIKMTIRKVKLGSASDLIGKALAGGGIQAAEKKLKHLLKRRPDGPVFDEGDFNALGYKLLQENNLVSAIFVFEKTVSLFPTSWNAWDSLGEILAKANQKKKAMTCYHKSLELNPKNKNAQQILKKLEN